MKRYNYHIKMDFENKETKKIEKGVQEVKAMKMNRYILFCLSHILLLSCQGQSKSSNVSKDSICVNSKMMDKQELMQTSILSRYGEDNGYNPLSYQDFQNRCMEYWGLSLHKEPQDYVLSIGGYTEYTINGMGRFLYTEQRIFFISRK